MAAYSMGECASITILGPQRTRDSRLRYMYETPAKGKTGKRNDDDALSICFEVEGVHERREFLAALFCVDTKDQNDQKCRNLHRNYIFGNGAKDGVAFFKFSADAHHRKFGFARKTAEIRILNEASPGKSEQKTQPGRHSPKFEDLKAMNARREEAIGKLNEALGNQIISSRYQAASFEKREASCRLALVLCDITTKSDSHRIVIGESDIIKSRKPPTLKTLRLGFTKEARLSHSLLATLSVEIERSQTLGVIVIIAWIGEQQFELEPTKNLDKKTVELTAAYKPGANTSVIDAIKNWNSENDVRFQVKIQLQSQMADKLVCLTTAEYKTKRVSDQFEVTFEENVPQNPSDVKLLTDFVTSDQLPEIFRTAGGAVKPGAAVRNVNTHVGDPGNVERDDSVMEHGDGANIEPMLDRIKRDSNVVHDGTANETNIFDTLKRELFLEDDEGLTNDKFDEIGDSSDTEPDVDKLMPTKMDDNDGLLPSPYNGVVHSMPHVGTSQMLPLQELQSAPNSMTLCYDAVCNESNSNGNNTAEYAGGNDNAAFNVPQMHCVTPNLQAQQCNAPWMPDDTCVNNASFPNQQSYSVMPVPFRQMMTDGGAEDEVMDWLAGGMN